MAKFDLDRLKERYGFKTDKVTGKRLQDLMQEIIASNNAKVSRRIASISKQNWERKTRKFNTKEFKTLIPDVIDVLPGRSVYTKKAAIEGKLITNRLRDGLTKDLRETLNTFTPKTGQENFIRRRGLGAGKINVNLINEFEKKITKRFESYTKKDKALAMPKNIHAIAVTEMRTTIDDIKEQYKNEMKAQNPGLEVKKTWIHNKSLSKEPRRGHEYLDGKTIDDDKLFRVKQYQKRGNRWFIVGEVFMTRPHDPTAPIKEIINCNCEAKYTVIKKA